MRMRQASALGPVYLDHTSVPASCRARRASAQSPRCRAQSARWHTVQQYCAPPACAGQLPHRLRYTDLPPGIIADKPEDVIPHAPQHFRRSTASQGLDVSILCGIGGA
jgi:hypothetical protein